MNKIIRIASLNPDLAALLLRLILGGLMTYHGYNKLVKFSEIAPKFDDVIGLGSTFSLALVVFGEFFCGIFIICGLLTRLSVIPVFITMFVAYFITHHDDAFRDKELAFVYLVLSLVVLVMGSGRFSIDKIIFKNENR